jgi:protein SCO1
VIDILTCPVPPIDRPHRPLRRAGGALLLVAAFLVGCSGSDPERRGSRAVAGDASPASHETQDGHEGHEAHAHQGSVPAWIPGDELPGGSLYNLEGRWWDRTGERVPLASKAGKVQVVSMVYTTCAFACPRIFSDMKRIESELTPLEREHVGFVLFSIDPERDTPERIARFESDLHIQPGRWSVLASEEANVLELAAVLGVRFIREESGEYSHSNVIAVLSPAGELVHRQLGLGENPAETLRTIRTQLAEAAMFMSLGTCGEDCTHGS